MLMFGSGGGFGNFFVAAVRFAELLRRIPSIIFINLILYSESIITFIGITLQTRKGAKYSGPRRASEVFWGLQAAGRTGGRCSATSVGASMIFCDLVP